MEATTLRELTVEHLGDTATEDDLEAFGSACEIMLDSGAFDDDADEATAIEFVWNDGDWAPRVQAILDGSLFDGVRNA